MLLCPSPSPSPTWFSGVLKECREGEYYCALALASPSPTWFPQVLKECREGEYYCALALALALLGSLGCSRNAGRVSITVP